MSRKSELVKVLQNFFQKLRSHSPATIREQRYWLLKTFLLNQKNSNWVNSGFVLPTVAMVSLVVVLLTTAMLFRSFERSKNASNVRVNETTLNAASPAVERARAKISKLFQDPRLPRSTPSNTSLAQVIESNVKEFTFGDETALKLKITDSLKSELGITSTLANEEREANTAWKYPVDTDNNGKFDSYTLYGIYYRTPANTTTTTSSTTTTTTKRSRTPLEARALPMDEGLSNSQCSSEVATSANLIDGQGWFKTSGKLKRSVFVYTTTVPITKDPKSEGIPDAKQDKYEVHKGNKGFAAIEYQQDRERIPINNNAVLYEDDLEIAAGQGLNINGRIFTNGNLLTRQDKVRYYLVSSDDSCYFLEENSKIIVAGNVVNSRVSESSDVGGEPRVDLFNKPYGDQNKEINNTNKSVPTTTYGNLAAYNDEAYARRIDRLVNATTALYPNKNQLPTEVQQEIDRDMAADKTLTYNNARDEQLRIYFRRRTRRVPYAEVAFGDDALTTNSTNYATTSPLIGSGETLRPINAWVFPFDPANPTDATSFAKIGINANGSDKIRLEATDPEIQIQAGKEDKIGDRILVGNNLPQYWFDTAKNKFIKETEEGQDITGKKWDAGSSKTRKRFSQAYQLDNLGITERDDFWEKSAAQKPEGILDIVGGVRVVTGGGIYLPNTITSANASTALTSLPTPTTPVSVWSDSMPMGIDANTSTAPGGMPSATTPYLRMRATAVYHYQKDTYNGEIPADYQAPIACISSYYDPSNTTTAKNRVGLPDVRLRDTQSTTPNRTVTSGGLPNVATTDTGGLSNNGVVYPATSLTVTSGYEAALKYQAQLKHPNGRPVNEQLQKAMAKRAASGNLTLAEQSAIDSAVCALKIFDQTISPSDAVIPHGAIKETSFLDARQIKAIDKTTGSRTYDLDVEQRQPLEIRTTVLDLDLLRRKSITGSVNSGSDFLIPNSGIIYATREDALADDSEKNKKDVSATDFKLDPTRRPNGIMLINGSDLSRNSTYKPEEKGLILASNLPVYIQGQKDATADEGYFNKHTQEEFTDKSLKTSTTSFATDFYARKNLNPNFACRSGQTGCGTGETWRPASVIADSITVLSHNFKLGFRQDGDYDLRDNYGNYPVGYDIDGSGLPLGTTQISLSEANLKLDLNADGDTVDTVNTLDETKLYVDIDGDGKNITTAVPITESNITATVAARLNGFWDNNFVTSRNFTDSNYSGGTTGAGSSYFNNFVTPIQRRVDYSEYVMEICRKATVTACTPSDWVVGYDDINQNGVSDNVTIDGISVAEKDIKANQLLKALANAKTLASAKVPPATFTFDITKLSAGTTARPAKDANDQGYPRRVAFLRHRTGQTVTRGTTDLTIDPITSKPRDPNTLVLDSGTPVPLGIIGSGSNLGVSYFPYSNTLTVDSITYSAYSTSNRPRTQANALWFKGINSTSENYDSQYPLWIENSGSLTGTTPTEQPLLVPVTQLQFPFITVASSKGATIEDKGDVTSNGSWLQFAKKTETNLVFAQGNTPGRPVESNGGLENFVRYLENWKGISHIASGAFIQFKRSSFATAPWQTFTATRVDDYITGFGAKTLFGYPQGYRSTVTADTSSKLGRSPFYNAPNRFWGYDVALLTQLPDLFSQRFTTPSVAEPNEFFREVGRDDAWVKTLLCAAEYNATTKAGYEFASDVGTGFKYAISQDQRPKACQ